MTQNKNCPVRRIFGKIVLLDGCPPGRIYLYFLLSLFCGQKMHEIDFSPLGLENQQKWLQFSEIIVGRHNLTQPAIT